MLLISAVDWVVLCAVSSDREHMYVGGRGGYEMLLRLGTLPYSVPCTVDYFLCSGRRLRKTGRLLRINGFTSEGTQHHESWGDEYARRLGIFLAFEPFHREATRVPTRVPARVPKSGKKEFWTARNHQSLVPCARYSTNPFDTAWLHGSWLHGLCEALMHSAVSSSPHTGSSNEPSA